jgi:hypothetical protein
MAKKTNGNTKPKGRPPARNNQGGVNSNDRATGLAPYQAYSAGSSHQPGVMNLSTVGASAHAIKRIEGIDQQPAKGIFLKPSPKLSDLTPLPRMAVEKWLPYSD